MARSRPSALAPDAGRIVASSGEIKIALLRLYSRSTHNAPPATRRSRAVWRSTKTSGRRMYRRSGLRRGGSPFATGKPGTRCVQKFPQLQQPAGPVMLRRAQTPPDLHPLSSFIIFDRNRNSYSSS